MPIMECHANNVDLPLTLQATRPDPHELVQLHHMVYSPDYMARADECAQSDNLIVKTVADHIKNGKPISYIRPN